MKSARPPRPATAGRPGHSPNATVAVGLPPELLDALAERVADVLIERGLVSAAAAVPEPEPWIGVEEAARHLACPKSRLYALVSARRIPCQKDASRLLFRRTELDAWLDAGGAKRP